MAFWKSKTPRFQERISKYINTFVFIPNQTTINAFQSIAKSVLISLICPRGIMQALSYSHVFYTYFIKVNVTADVF